MGKGRFLLDQTNNSLLMWTLPTDMKNSYPALSDKKQKELKAK